MTTDSLHAQRFKLGTITITLTPTSDRAGRRFYTAAITRWSKDRHGNKVEAKDFRPCDFPVLRSLALQAVEWLSARSIVDVSKPTPSTTGTDPALAALCALIEQQFTR